MARTPGTGRPVGARAPQAGRGVCLIVTILLLGTTLTACGGSNDHSPTAATPSPVAAINTAVQTAEATTPSLAPATTTTNLQAQPTAEPATATETEAVTEDVTAISTEELQALVDGLVGEAPGFAEVVVELPDGSVLVDVNGAEPMESASLYKLGVMIEVFHQREEGLLSFDDGIVLEPGYFTEGEDVYGYGDIGSVVDVQSLLYSMITLSSNVAATALLATVGNENINATLASLGIANTEIRWMPDPSAEPAVDDGSGGDNGTPVDDGTSEPDPAATEEPTDTTGEDPVPGEDPTPTEEPSGSAGQVVLLSAHSRPTGPNVSSHTDSRADGALNVTTAEDMANLYMLLLAGEVMGPEVSQEMLDLLSLQEINDRLPAYLPEGVIVAHKTGNLDGLVHDAGVIYAPNGPIIVSVLTEDMDEGVAVDLIAQVALAAYEANS